jgi:hypothetical protein
LFHAKAALRKSGKLKVFSKNLQHRPIRQLAAARKVSKIAQFEAKPNLSNNAA